MCSHRSFRVYNTSITSSVEFHGSFRGRSERLHRLFDGSFRGNVCSSFRPFHEVPHAASIFLHVCTSTSVRRLLRSSHTCVLLTQANPKPNPSRNPCFLKVYAWLVWFGNTLGHWAWDYSGSTCLEMLYYYRAEIHC